MKSLESTKRRPTRRGFTLVEVMIAASVLVLCITSSLVALQFGMKAIDNARYTTLAGQILQSQMEKIRLLTWTQLTDPSTGPVAATYFQPDISAVASEHIERFTCWQRIVPAPSPFDATMRDVTLYAIWRGIDNKLHWLSYYSRYGRNGISDFFYTVH